MMETAFDSVRDSYDIETLRDIRDYGCVSGVAHDHIYYHETIKFYDSYQDEIVEYIEDTVGTEVLTDIFTKNDASLDAYKNDVVWCYIELVAGLLVDQYEDTTQEELSDGDVHDITNAIGMNSLSENTYEAVKELASTPWGQNHLEIINA
tara:strand:+ start:164 stop:613 length:450 start_codon:yes stop_codon:yes gene_type:complete